MSDVILKLDENLKQQVVIYDKLYALEKDKQKALLNNKLQEIEMTTLQEEQLMHEASQLEKERLLWAEQIGRQLGTTPEDLTLAELATHFPELQGVRFDLDRVVVSLQEIHEINVQLLEQSIKIVEFTVGMFTHQEKNTYSNPRRKENEGNSKLHLLDRRI